MSPDLVFGYGSLLRRPAAIEPPEGAVRAFLDGHRRGWNVAMDNRRTIPGYKYYVDAGTGERPDVYVTFLNIWPDPGARVNGLVFPATAGVLEALDRRERNYTREDVTDLVDVDARGRVWAYVGSLAGRNRYVAGLRAGTAVVSAQYARTVRADFGSFGPDWLAAFDATTDRLEVPLRELRRISLPDRREAPDRAAVEGGA